jgi:transcriptional regulator with XRE-family HTH domain
VQDDDSIGARIAAQRKLRGLTQEQLAHRAHVSLSLLRKVEQGSRQVTHQLVASVAAGLGVERNELTGQPYRSGDRTLDAVHDLIPELRRELVAYRLPPAADRQIPPLEALRTQVAEVSRARHNVDLAALGTALPSALGDLRAAAWGTTGPDRERLMRLLAEVYYAARQFVSKLGYPDLALLVADRYEWAAEQSGDPLAVALAGVFRAGELDAAADTRGARATMTATLDTIMPADDEGTLSVHGFLHLMSAYMSAHAGDADDTWSHWRAAEELATRLGHDRDAYRLAFGPTNVAIWGTALGVELMDGAKAVERAQHVRMTAQTPPERQGHHFIDLARGQLMNGDTAGALASMYTARRIAPQQTRYHPLARETVYALARAERRSTESLRGLAAWMGVPD